MLFDETSAKPLYEQIYEHYRMGIESGMYAPKTKLPPIRSLAQDLSCARNTVEAAYRKLAQEGYVESRAGSGYVVQDVQAFLTAPLKTASAPGLAPCGASGKDPAGGGCTAAHEGAGAKLPNGEALCAPHISDAKANAFSAPNENIRFDFTYGNLQKGTFPAAAWRTLTNDILMGLERSTADSYTDPLGEAELREELARRLKAMRGIECLPERIVIQGGTQSSVQNLLTLFDRGTTVATEDPGYDGVRMAIERSGFSIAPCRIDTDLFFEDLAKSNARLAYVTPSSQFPTCRVMPIESRKRLLDWADENDAYILEDDYCRDFRYKERAVPPLRSMDRNDRVIYMGTFSKSLSPALRMNYLVLPGALHGLWQKQFKGAYSAVPWLNQAIVGRFMKSGMWDSHLRKLQASNRRKYEALVGAIHRHMGERVNLVENGTGLHALVHVPGTRSQDELIAEAAAAGVRVYSTAQYWARPQDATRGCVLVGFSAIDEADIEPGIRALAGAWFANAED